VSNAPHIRGDLSDREMLLILTEQTHQVQVAIDRLAASVEARLALGDRRFSELEQARIEFDRRHAAINTALNSLNSMAVQAERSVASIGTKAAEHYAEWATWKTRAQTAAWVAGFVWAVFQFIIPYLPRIVEVINP